LLILFDFPFDVASTSGFEFVGLMPARALRSRPLVSVAFGSLPTPRRFAVPAATFERAAFPRGPRCPTKPRKVHGFKPRRKEHHMSKKNVPPSHRLYAVSKNGKQSYWQPIGAIWPHADGEGFSVQLDYLPRDPDAEIVIRKPKAKAEEADAPAGEAA
jgi:hypothetical protein